LLVRLPCFARPSIPNNGFLSECANSCGKYTKAL
jgi:hypothetical protein